MEAKLKSRRFDLDWIRVIAILTIFIFHTGRFFDPYDWHVKNPIKSDAMGIWTSFLVSWGMPLIFTISGASLFFSLGKVGKFIKDKALRLLVPLVVGVFTHVALGVYFERVTHYQFIGSFFEFYPHYFDGYYAFDGNFAWMGLHLWYLLVLFVFSLVFMPIFYLLKGSGKSFTLSFGNFAALPGVFYLLAVPVSLIMVTLNPNTVLGARSWGGWNLIGYIPFFFYGYLIMASERLQSSIKKFRWVSLALAIICTLILAYFSIQYEPVFFRTREYAVIYGLYGLSAWLWILTIFGICMRYLNVYRKFIVYATEAVLPFYILHQTVLLSVGFFVVRWDLPAPLKFVVIGTSSFVIVISLYEFLIRRSNLLRVLFGMRPIPKKQTAPMDAETIPAG